MVEQWNRDRETLEDLMVEQWNRWWNSRTIMVEQWNRDGRTVENLMVEESNRDDGTVEQLNI